MKIEQMYTGCLAEAAYYIESNGEAAIIDPLREVAPYIERARLDRASIKYVFETHFHADFVSGHLDLAHKTGAKIIFGPSARPNFEAYIAKDGEDFQIGDITIRALHTPGHTMESVTYLLLDEHNNKRAIFTGDTLFIGDVGRPDLAVRNNLTCEDLAGHLFDSLRNKIMPLPDSIIVYPGHGAGSACGKKMSMETSDTLGNQKLLNYALRTDMTREEFIKEVTAGLTEPPQYFPKNAVLNKEGYRSIDEILNNGVIGLELREFMNFVVRNEALILDTRPRNEFMQAFIPGSLWIGLEDNFAPWVGALIEDLNRPIVFLATPGKEEEVVTRLARVGYDNALGYLEGGITAWMADNRETYSIERITAADFAYTYQTSSVNLIDVRRASEYDAQHITRAENYPLERLSRDAEGLLPQKMYYIYCQGGYRSVIAASILKRIGFTNVVNIDGGFEESAGYINNLSDYKEPVTFL